MRKLPRCPCQEGDYEFEWEDMASGGPRFGGYQVYLCPECLRRAYYIESFGIFFLPLRSKAPDEEILLWLLRLEHTLATLRSTAEERDVFTQIPQVPNSIQLYSSLEGKWRKIEGALRLRVPSQVLHKKPTLLELRYLVWIFLKLRPCPLLVYRE